MSQTVCAESLDYRAIMAVESEPDALHLNTCIPVVPTLAIAVAAQALVEGQDDSY